MSFYNTYVTKLISSYTGGNKIRFWEDCSTDYVTSSFEALLGKFKAEGKLESYQNLDIQYKKYTQSFVTYYFSKLWWNHGYSVWNIVLWTLFFLIVFCIYNFTMWDSIYTTYPIYSSHSSSSVSPMDNKYLRVLVFTISIFFALKIDVGLINFKKRNPVVMLAFQYTVGLVCLVFIANAILKF